MTEGSAIREIFSGAPRPRQQRFSATLKEVCAEMHLNLLLSPKRNFASRLCANGNAMLRHARTIALNDTIPTILHQCIASTDRAPSMAELDVPLALFNYSFERRARGLSKVKRLLALNSLKKILVFSEWAKRSFVLHFGAEHSQKIEVLYPLANEHSTDTDSSKSIDFAFVSTQFAIKAGPQTVRAFQRIRRSKNLRMAVVTNLKEARECLGDLNSYHGIDWIPANQSSREIGSLLSKTWCLVHPSLFDSFGVVVLEALAAGCSIISTNISSFPEMVTSGENGFLIVPPIAAVTFDDFVHPYTPCLFGRLLHSMDLRNLEDEIYSSMVKISSDPHLRSSFSSASSSIFQSRFHKSVWKGQMRRLITECLLNRGAE